ncbi:MAG: alkane 1-monooxygenase [Bacteroidetes bacterium]|nr:MAG: alkane 1-monooxygenase [Bacteroidota bacterium]REK00034.1 MAG: alkane 1-monooxygenase [Bacteroidota bacterium]REK35785.1 MAG: alkane 1-monooxygenase [Bacteroidota bacterium]REK49342.1 MAG: alkane 1-monooxygenase [Bacteroidota bacterium]
MMISNRESGCNCRYFWSLLPGIVTAASMYAGEWWVVSNVILTLFILPVIEFFLPEDKSNSSNENSFIPDFILVMHFLIQPVILLLLFWNIYSGSIHGIQLFFAGLSVGIHSGSSSIIVAHEMIHRKSSIWQTMGKILLFSAGNIYFFVDHLRVHHKWVGTDKDPATARKGESVHSFFFRSAGGQIRSSWKLECERLRSLGKSPYGFGNYVLSSSVLLLLLMAVIYHYTGIAGLFVFAYQALMANFLLEFVNYIEHYGLTRDENVRVDPTHSWQSDKVLSRFFLVELSRHSDHHYYSSKPYHVLKSYDESPVLPGGYAQIFFFALIPALWYRKVDPILEDYLKKVKKQV